MTQQQSDDAARLARLEAYWLLGYGQRRAEMAGIDAMPDDGEENAYVRRGYEQLDPPPFIQHDPIQQKCLRDCLAKLHALAAAEQRGYERGKAEIELPWCCGHCKAANAEMRGRKEVLDLVFALRKNGRSYIERGEQSLGEILKMAAAKWPDWQDA